MADPTKNLKKGKKDIGTVKAVMEDEGVVTEEELEQEFLDEEDAVAQSMQYKIGRVIEILTNVKGILRRIDNGEVKHVHFNDEIKEMYNEVDDLLGAQMFSSAHPVKSLSMDNDEVYRLRDVDDLKRETNEKRRREIEKEIVEKRNKIKEMLEKTDSLISHLMVYQSAGIKTIGETEETKTLLRNLRALEHAEHDRLSSKAEHAIHDLEKHAKKSGVDQALTLEVESLALLKKNQAYVVERAKRLIKALEVSASVCDEILDIYTSSPDFYNGKVMQLRDELGRIAAVLGRKDFREVTGRILADLIKVIDNAELREKSVKALKTYISKVTGDLAQVVKVGPDAVRKLDFAQSTYQKILNSLESN